MRWEFPCRVGSATNSLCGNGSLRGRAGSPGGGGVSSRILRVCALLAAVICGAAAALPQSTSVSEDAQSHYEAAQAHWRAGQTQEAEREFLRALALDPSRNEILLDLAKLHIRGNALTEAEQNLRGYLKANPESSLALALAGEVKFRQKDFAAAEKYFRESERWHREVN